MCIIDLFRGSVATDRQWYHRLYHLGLTEKPVGPWITKATARVMILALGLPRHIVEPSC